MVELLVKQNGRLREAWEAERKYLQANRERAEEVYREERALMDEERMGWVAERTMLLDELAFLKQELGGLAAEYTRPSPVQTVIIALQVIPYAAEDGKHRQKASGARSHHREMGKLPERGASTLASVQEAGIQEPGPSRSYPGFNQGQQPVHASSAGNHQQHSAAFVVEPLESKLCSGISIRPNV